MSVAELKRAHALRHAAGIVGWAHGVLGLSFEEIGAAVGADERTVRRWRSAEVAPRGRHQARLDELVELRHLLGEVFPGAREAAEWLETPVRAFRGHAPIAMLRRGRLASVVEALATMESGAYL